MIVILPGLALFLLRREGWGEFRSRLGLFGAALLPGLISYAVLPLRAERWPPLNWGNPSNLYRFWVHISARDYQVNIESSLPVIADHARRFLEAWRGEFTAAGLLLAGLALLLFRRDRGAVSGLVLVLAGDIGFAIRYEIAEDQAAYYLPAFLVTSLLLVAAAAWIGERARQGRLVSGATLAAALLLALLHGAARARRHDLRAPETAEDALASIPPGGLALTSEWNVYSPLLASQDVQHQRTDALILDVLLLRRGWYLDSFARSHSDRFEEVRPELAAYRAGLADWEEGRPYDAAHLTALYNLFVRKLVVAAWARGVAAVWFGTVLGDLLPTGAALVPNGLGYRILPDRNAAAIWLAAPPPTLKAALRPSLPVDYIFDSKIRPLYSGMLVQRALYDAGFRRTGDAKGEVELARRLDPGNPAAAEVLGDLLAAEGRPVDALALYAEALGHGGDPARIAGKSRRLSGGPSVNPP